MQLIQNQRHSCPLFSSTGILRNIQEEILATRNGRIEVTNVSDTRTVSNQNATNETNREFIGTFRNEDDDEEEGGGGTAFNGGWGDPLAQTILSSVTGGEFVTKIDAYFQRKDPNIPVLCQIREVVNGFPTRKVLPFGQKFLKPYMDGTVAMTGGGTTTVTGTNTKFLTGSSNLKVGDTITIADPVIQPLVLFKTLETTIHQHLLQKLLQLHLIHHLR